MLEVQDLVVAFENQAAPVVQGVAFEIGRGEAVGLLGESGCGKTTTGLCLLGLPPAGARVLRGSVRVFGRDILGLDDRELQSVRGARVAAIFQEPGLALHPTLRAGRQIEEVLIAHRSWGRARRQAEVHTLLERVRLDRVPGILEAYPHQLSGGQRQRLLVAQAIACGPALLVADEPTAALDSVLSQELLLLLRDLRQSLGLALLLISHDPKVLAAVVSRVLVMYAGRIVEEGPLPDLFADPLHPYTRGLLSCLPGRLTRPGGEALMAIPGQPPGPDDAPAGCPFAPRCPQRLPVCEEGFPGESRPSAGRRVHCVQHAG